MSEELGISGCEAKVHTFGVRSVTKTISDGRGCRLGRLSLGDGKLPKARCPCFLLVLGTRSLSSHLES